MNWQTRPQRFGAAEREMPQSVHRSRGMAGDNGGAHSGAACCSMLNLQILVKEVAGMAGDPHHPGHRF
jgi:hypothetical protein